jgi:glycosyltransferase involved in cell wall biosynthesis
MDKVSVIIPARNEPYLAKTIEDLFAKAGGEIEVVVVLDGYRPDPPLRERRNLILHHNIKPVGMRAALNQAALNSNGKYLLKIDAHSMVGENYDVILQEDCEYDWLTVPSRYALEVEDWKRREGMPTEYLFLTFPYVQEEQFGTGLHGKKWTGATRGKEGWWEPERKFKDKLLDDIIIWQGSCWFMHRQQYYDIDMLDTRYSYNMFQEANELAFKTWLSGGRLLVNKKTWYAHWHKKGGTAGYGLSKQAKLDTEKTSTHFWMNNRWIKQVRSVRWLIDKFMPMPGWPENWEEEKARHEVESPELWAGKNIRVFDQNGWEGLKWT